MGKSSVRAAVLAAMVVVLAAAAALRVGADDELQMEKIVVTATRTATAILDSPDHVTVIEGEELAGAGTATLAEALGQVAGVEVADNGTAGSVQALRIRGSASSQVLVLVDGMRVNDSWLGMVDLSALPVANVERIEILRGGTSALYGADALGGVVNIITKGRAEKAVTLTVANGSYLPREAVEVSEGPTETPVDADYRDLVDTQRVGLQVSRSLGSVDVLVGGSFTRAANGFVWRDGEYIDDYRRQVNAALLAGDASLSLTAPAGAGHLGLKAHLNYSDAGMPGGVNPTWVSTDAAQQRASFQGQLFYDNPQLAGSDLSLQARVFYKHTDLAYQQPSFAVDDVHILDSLGVELQQQTAVGGRFELVYGGSLLADWVDSTQAGQRRRFSGGAFLEAPLHVGPALVLTPTVRCDLDSLFPPNLTYKLAAVFALSPRASLKASGGKSYRAPTMIDLYYPLGSNPDLQPEIGYSADLGLSVITERLEANLFAFARYVLDGIALDLAWIPQNLGEALYPGAEADVSVRLPGHVSVSGSYTFLYSFLLEGKDFSYGFDDDKRAIYTPVHAAGLSARFDNGRTRVGADLDYVGERFKDEANTIPVPGYLVLNAQLRQRLSENLALTLAGKNLTNRVYQTVKDYVMPPLSVWVGAEISF